VNCFLCINVIIVKTRQVTEVNLSFLLCTYAEGSASDPAMGNGSPGKDVCGSFNQQSYVAQRGPAPLSGISVFDTVG